MPNYSKTFIESTFALSDESPTGVIWLKNARSKKSPEGAASKGDHMLDHEHSIKGGLHAATIKKRLDSYKNQRNGIVANDHEEELTRRVARSHERATDTDIAKKLREAKKEDTFHNRLTLIAMGYQQVFSEVKLLVGGFMVAYAGRHGRFKSVNGLTWEKMAPTEKNRKRVVFEGMRYILLSPEQLVKRTYDYVSVSKPMNGWTREEIHNVQEEAGMEMSKTSIQCEDDFLRMLDRRKAELKAE